MKTIATPGCFWLPARGSAAEDPLLAAKDLYASASYEALTTLSGISRLPLRSLGRLTWDAPSVCTPWRTAEAEKVAGRSFVANDGAR
jgi:hypothetical protein